MSLGFHVISFENTLRFNYFANREFISLPSDRENLGSIRMKVRLTQERILPQKCYQPLTEILVNCTNDPESLDPTVLSLIDQLTTADLSTLAHQLVRLFIGQDLVIPFLDYVTLLEIRKTSEENQKVFLYCLLCLYVYHDTSHATRKKKPTNKSRKDR